MCGSCPQVIRTPFQARILHCNEESTDARRSSEFCNAIANRLLSALTGRLGRLVGQSYRLGAARPSEQASAHARLHRAVAAVDDLCDSSSWRCCRLVAGVCITECPGDGHAGDGLRLSGFIFGALVAQLRVRADRIILRRPRRLDRGHACTAFGIIGDHRGAGARASACSAPLRSGRRASAAAGVDRRTMPRRCLARQPASSLPKLDFAAATQDQVGLHRSCLRVLTEPLPSPTER